MSFMDDDIYLQPPKYSSYFNIHVSRQFYVKASHRKTWLCISQLGGMISHLLSCKQFPIFYVSLVAWTTELVTSTCPCHSPSVLYSTVDTYPAVLYCVDKICYHMVLKSLEGSWCVLRDVWSPWNLTRMTGTILVRFPLKFEEIVIPTLHRDCATIRLDRSPLVAQRSPTSCLGSLKLLRPCRGHHSCRGRWGGWLLTGCSNGAGGRHVSPWSQWSANGCPVTNSYCCKHYLSVWAMFLPPLYRLLWPT